VRVSTTNLAASWTLTANPALAAGYTTAALFDGHASLLTRTAAFGPSTAAFVWDRGAGFVAADYVVAIFGLRSKSLGVANVTTTRVYDTTDGVAAGITLVGSYTLDDRGDAWVKVHTTQRYLHIKFDHTASDQADVGEIWVGAYTDFTRDIIGPYDHPESIASRLNDADDGTLWADQLADRVDELSFGWDSLLSSEYQEVRDYWRAVRGAVRSHVVIPDATATDVYLGKLTSARLPRQVDAPIVRNVSLGFKATGHYFYG
jgi:hypothetical protein